MSVTDPASHWLQADWPAPANVRTLITTRQGGHSLQPFNSFNLGSHVGDDADAVAANRELLRSQLPSEPAWLNQVHGTHVVNAAEVGDSLLDADASFSTTPGKVCVVMTADCLPVLLCNDAARWWPQRMPAGAGCAMACWKPAWRPPAWSHPA
jgi:copper oxidase (laccase) domain-containing protein